MLLRILLVCMRHVRGLAIRPGKKGPIARKQMGTSNQDASTNDLSLRIICCHPLHVLPHQPLCSLFITTAVQLGLYQLTVASSQTPPTHHDSDPRPLIIQPPSYNVASRVTLSVLRLIILSHLSHNVQFRYIHKKQLKDITKLPNM